MLIGAAVGFAAAAVTANPYLGVVAAALAGVAANLLFSYVVITRRANQLAAGLSLMFFGFGASALIGRPFVGAIVPGLPHLGAFDLWSGSPPRLAFVLWGLLSAPAGGSRCARSAKIPAAAFAAGRRPDGCNTKRWRSRARLAGSAAPISRWRWR